MSLFAELDNPVYEQERLARYAFAQEHVSGQRVIDAGCGARDGPLLLARGAEGVVVGVDVDPRAVKLAAARYASPRVTYAAMDGRAMALGPASFDAVVSFEVIEHLPEADHEPYLREMRRLLKPGGLYLGSTPNAAFTTDLDPNESHEHEYAFAEYEGLLRRVFAEVAVLSQCVPPDLRRQARALEDAKAAFQRIPLSRAYALLPKALRRALRGAFARLGLHVPGTGSIASAIRIVPGHVEPCGNFIALCRRVGRGPEPG